MKLARKWRNLSHLLKHVGKCGKVRHLTQDTAEAEAARLAGIFRVNQQFVAYRCKRCLWFHVGSNSYSPPRNEAARKRGAAPQRG